jgi:hypothetical protein
MREEERGLVEKLGEVWVVVAAFTRCRKNESIVSHEAAAERR